MLDAGVWVRCLEVKAGKVLVREMDPPADMTDMGQESARPASPQVMLDPTPPVQETRKADDLDDLDLGLDR